VAGDPYQGTCDLCGHGPVRVREQRYPGRDGEVVSCSVCHDSGLWQVHAGAGSALASALGRLVNVLVDAQGPAHREVCEALLRGEGLPSAEWDEF
jgi:hypothetical protein